jgi:16S rRNA U516 pseudouridylate synthase RsuA-like enzyme
VRDDKGKALTTPKTKDRNLPHINITINRWMNDWLQEMHTASGLPVSRLIREMIEQAHRSGYSPGRMTIRDFQHGAHMRHPS